MSLYHRAQLQNTVEISVLQNIIIFLLQNLWKFGSHWVTCLSFHAKILPYLPVIMHLLICKNQPSSFSVPFVLDLRADVLSLHLSLRFTGPIPHWRGITQDPEWSCKLLCVWAAVPATGVTSAFKPSPAYMSDACGRCTVLEKIWSLLESTLNQNVFPGPWPQRDVGKSHPTTFPLCPHYLLCLFIFLYVTDTICTYHT